MDGQVLRAVWSRSTDGLEPRLVHDGVLLATAPGRLVALEGETGAEMWTLDVPAERPNRISVEAESDIHYVVGYHHLVIDIDLGEVVEDRPLAAHAGEGPDAWPVSHRVSDDEIFEASVGPFVLRVGHNSLSVAEASTSTRTGSFTADVHVRHRYDHVAPVVDPDAPLAYVALADGSLWCFSGGDEGDPVAPGPRTRVNPMAHLADALHVRATDPLGLQARLSLVPPQVAAEALLDWAVRSATSAAFSGAGFDESVDELDDIGSLIGWHLLPEEASAVGEVLSVVWDEDDLDRKAGEVAGVVWTLMASALAGIDAVESRAVLLVERSRVLAAHPAELPIHELGGAYPYLTAGAPDDLDEHSDDVRRTTLGLLAAAATARAVDLAPDADDVLNEIRATGFEVLEDLLAGDT